MYESEALRKIQEVREKYCKPAEEDSEEDELDFLVKQRIQRDEHQYEQKKAVRSQREKELKMREVLGSSAWTEKKIADSKQREQERRDAEKSNLGVDIEKRRMEREMRKDEVRDLAAKSGEIDEMKKRWAAVDDARSKQEADDLAYEREKKWARQVSEKEAIRRERERFRDERALRIEALAVKANVRENTYKSDQEKDSFDAEHWQQSAIQRKREVDRAVHRATDPSQQKELTDDPYSLLSFLEVKQKHNGRDYRRRAQESELANQDMKQWYLDRDYDRGNAKIRQNRIIYS